MTSHGRWRVFRADRKSTRLNSSHTVIYTLSLHDALPIRQDPRHHRAMNDRVRHAAALIDAEDDIPREMARIPGRSEEHTSELQSHSDLHSFPTRRSSDPPGSPPSPRYE